MNKMAITPRRPSPRVEGMHHYTAPDGTIWAFESREKMDDFVRKGKDKKKYRHYLSQREIYNFLYGDREMSVEL